jgi:hypothetical protein
VDLWLWTQVNRATIEVVMGVLGEPMEKAHTVMDKWGYTGSACLPMALDDAARAGRLRPGDLVVLTGSGAGLSMGCVSLRWTRNGGQWLRPPPPSSWSASPATATGRRCAPSRPAAPRATRR